MFYSTSRGAYPGYDDALKNMPLPAGRNRLAVDLIQRTANPKLLAGFSADLTILEANSRTLPHDGPAGSFYQTLRRGEEYRGYFRQPFSEIAELFHSLSMEKGAGIPSASGAVDRSIVGPVSYLQVDLVMAIWLNHGGRGALREPPLPIAGRGG